jgi:hypothetical protein
LLSGWREGSRISFKISNIQISYNEIPYQSYPLVVPSGKCTISGAMNYHAQADNSIFSEGVYLVNATENDVLSEVYNPSYVSPVIRRVPWLNIISGSGKMTEPILEAPSVMKVRANPSGISQSQKYVGLLNGAPSNYNKLNWPALSDLETLNGGETIEEIPPDDGNTFTNSTMLFSASQGQSLPNGRQNPNIVKRYGVKEQYQLYDSLATDAIVNSGKCVTSRRGRSILLVQSEMSGALAPVGSTLSTIQQGLV